MTLHSILIQKLLSTKAHVGRQVATHHFKLYTYGFRNRMAIIDSDKTLICMRNALNFIGSLVRQKGRFMFVNTNWLFDEIIEEMTKKIGCYSPNATALWKMSGILTNSGNPKKFRSRHKKLCFGPTQPPDCLVVIDTERKSSVIMEADRLQVPIVALVDSSMPLEIYKRIAYPIPANDSVQFIYLFCNLITKTFLYEQKRLGSTEAVAVEEELPKAQPREGLDHVEEQMKIDDVLKKELLLVPYGSLAPLPDDIAETKNLLDKLVVLKFNGVLGTAMGFNGPKSAIKVFGDSTPLDLFVEQIEFLNGKYGCNVPLIILDSAETHDETLKAMGQYKKSRIDVHSLIQGQNLQLNPFQKPKEHDDLYTSDHGPLLLSLLTGGTLDVLLSKGKEFALVVGSDNVAAVIDPQILNYLIQNKIEFCLEVTPAAALESSSSTYSTPERCQLADISLNSSQSPMVKFKFSDTRSLWLNLTTIKRLVDTNTLKIETSSFSEVGSSDKQLLLQKTAVGSMIKFFDRVVGINVPYPRSLQLSSTSDLLLLQSDLYTSNKGLVVRNAARASPVNPSIDLGPEFEKINDFRSRFKSIPSIVELDSLTVRGDVWFGLGVALKGNVSIIAKPGVKMEIPDGAVLENQEINDPTDIK
ncbi:UTP--glucose-1-phosphate uridylyltransferase-like [Benincasa hispida]|uniref:UTP--glucose-1-phosphate uridylyltransferase-like n=1 Tax=Benincasa hispida TaxID=102211 RepID=UPI001900BB90|nr:UTP--glucose-1-phosphate uridylyltransferase-like [Benincasa hispida]